MTDLTTAQQNTLRRRIGDTSDTPAFANDELQDAFNEAAESLDATTVILLEWLLADAVKLHTYKAGQTTENMDQVYDHLKDRLTYWTSKTAVSQQMKIVGMRSVPPRDRDMPADEIAEEARASRRWRNSNA